MPPHPDDEHTVDLGDVVLAFHEEQRPPLLERMRGHAAGWCWAMVRMWDRLARWVEP